MKNVLISSESRFDFNCQVNNYMDKGWTMVPGSLIVKLGEDSVKMFVIVLERAK